MREDESDLDEVTEMESWSHHRCPHQAHVKRLVQQRQEEEMQRLAVCKALFDITIKRYA